MFYNFIRKLYQKDLSLHQKTIASLENLDFRRKWAFLSENNRVIRPAIGPANMISCRDVT